MTTSALIVLSDGCEDIEAVTPIDILTRAGVKLTVAGLTSTTIRCAYGNTLTAQTTIEDVDHIFDAIVLPGGQKNAASLAASTEVVALVREHYADSRLVAALCASAGYVLGEAAGILRDHRATGWPTFDEKLRVGGATVTGELVTVDGNLITGQGPGAALPFSLAVVEYLVGKETADHLAEIWWLDRLPDAIRR